MVFQWGHGTVITSHFALSVLFKNVFCAVYSFYNFYSKYDNPYRTCISSMDLLLSITYYIVSEHLIFSAKLYFIRDYKMFNQTLDWLSFCLFVFHREPRCSIG
jgi:hypothetical protein